MTSFQQAPYSVTIILMNSKLRQRRKNLFQLQHLCLFIQHQKMCLSQLLQLDITIQTSHHPLITRSECQVILFCYVNGKKCNYILLSCFFLFLSSLNKFCIISGTSDQFALKVSLPVITVFIVLLLCAMAVVFYLR